MKVKEGDILKLIDEMSPEEKMAQMLYFAPSLKRLGVVEYNWWNEALHGVSRAGTATVFPQAIGLAATFDFPLVRKVANAIADEGRGKFNEYSQRNDRRAYKGLTFWSPNVNIFRDPRWGRGHETYGEDPCLTAMTARSFIEGLQQEENGFLKASACVKHYAVHSGPEEKRHSFNAIVSRRDLHETYLYAFKKAVECGVTGVMTAYNRVNGEACSASRSLLSKILREEWKFDGYVVSDCGAISDIHGGHGITKSEQESIALAVSNGCDLNCGWEFDALTKAYRDGLVTESMLDESINRLFTLRAKLGVLLDEEKAEPFKKLDYKAVDRKRHRLLNLSAAEASLIMLKNEGLLPVGKIKGKTIAVIGPNMDSIRSIEGNYTGTSNTYMTVLEGVHKYFPGNKIISAMGCHLHKDYLDPISGGGDGLTEAAIIADMADFIIMCLGLDNTLEGEQGDPSNAYPGGDKPDILLPKPQRELWRTVAALGKPIITIVLSGSCLALDDIEEKSGAIIQAFYPGALTGTAVARLIRGDFSPSGRLPVTFYSRHNTLPDFENYSMEGRTYRYMSEKPLYPFGYGLSYASFKYEEIECNVTNNDDELVLINVQIVNESDIKAHEVVEIFYIGRTSDGWVGNPKFMTAKRVLFNPGERKAIEFQIEKGSLIYFDDMGHERISGEYTIFAGSNQPDRRSFELTGKKCLKINLKMR